MLKQLTYILLLQGWCWLIPYVSRTMLWSLLICNTFLTSSVHLFGRAHKSNAKYLNKCKQHTMLFYFSWNIFNMPKCCRVNLEKFHSEKGKRSHKCSYSTFLYTAPWRLFPSLNSYSIWEENKNYFNNKKFSLKKNQINNFIHCIY